MAANRAGDNWATAVLRYHTARCLRLDGKLSDAEQDASIAVTLAPRYTDALLELGRVYMDSSAFDQAIRTFQMALKVDRAHDLVESWLVRAHVQMKRVDADKASRQRTRQELMKADETEYCIAWRCVVQMSPRSA